MYSITSLVYGANYSLMFELLLKLCCVFEKKLLLYHVGDPLNKHNIHFFVGLVKALHAVNCSAWHDAFLALWIASLRLVQRVRYCATS